MQENVDIKIKAKASGSIKVAQTGYVHDLMEVYLRVVAELASKFALPDVGVTELAENLHSRILQNLMDSQKGERKMKKKEVGHVNITILGTKIAIDAEGSIGEIMSALIQVLADVAVDGMKENVDVNAAAKEVADAVVQAIIKKKAEK